MQRRPFGSLHFKIASGVILTILALASLDFALDAVLYRRQFLEELEASSVNLSKVALQGLVELAMLGRHPELLQGAIERLDKDSGVLDVLLLDLSGEVHFSADRSKIGQVYRQQDAGCRECHQQAGSALPTSIFLRTPAGETLRTATPVPNRKECHPCHDPQQATNGILVIDFSTAGRWKELRAHLQSRLLKTGVTVSLILLVLGLLMNRVVIRRIQNLTQAARLLTRTPGAEAAKVPANEDSSSDEIGQLTQSFKEMVGELTASIHALHSQKSYLQGLMNGLQDGLVVVDRNLTVEHANEAAFRIWGVKKLEGLPIAETPLGLAGGEVRESFRSGQLLRAETKSPTPGAEVLEYCCSPVRDPGGEVLRVIVLFRDVTEQKMLERQVSRAERLASLGQLAAGVAHEINNPMAAVTTCVEGLDRYLGSVEGVSETDKNEIRDYLETIGEAALRCSEISQRLLSLCEDPADAEFRRVDLREMVRRVVRLVEHQAKNRGVQIQTSLNGDATVLGDSKRLSELLLNLVLNSLEAVSEGGQVCVSVTPQDRAVELKVADNGCGIPEEHLERLFDPFFTSKRSGRGTGLGLAICEGIVRRHQGRISVSSKLGEGTQVCVLFPEGPAREP